MKKSKFIIASAWLVLLLAVLGTAGNDVGGVQPTTTFADYFGDVNLTRGVGAPVGTVVSAVSVSSNTLIGKFVVETNGKYGLMHVYGDDSVTPQIEGPLEGQLVNFFVNGTFAATLKFPAANSNSIRLDLLVNASSVGSGDESKKKGRRLDRREIKINHIRELSGEVVRRGEDLLIGVDFEEEVGHEQEEVKVNIWIPELGFRRSEGPFDLGAKDDTFIRVPVYIEQDAQPGIYQYRVTISNDNFRRVRHRQFEIVE